MNLNHLNLSVSDVAESRAFFETYFGLRCINEKGAGALAVLVDDSDFVLVLSHLSNTEKPCYPLP